MRKSILLLATFLCSSLSFAQFLTTGTLTSDNKYRSGGIGIGYTALPSFGTNKFLVNGNSFFNGNIGIGTSLPSGKLHINNGDFRLDSGKFYLDYTGSPVIVDNSDIYGIYSSKSIFLSNSDKVNLSINRNDGLIFSSLNASIAHVDGAWALNSKKGDVVLSAYSKGSLIISNHGEGDIKFSTTINGSTPTDYYFTTDVRMRIDKYGNVGIGTGSSSINPDDKLAVNGLIHTKEVKVDLVGWPDYVFEKDYDLISLSDLEKKIIENKHLPEIPSAREVEENGVLLGDMNKKLLQKVEELTLYIIEMNKEIQKLKEKLNN